MHCWISASLPAGVVGVAVPLQLPAPWLGVELAGALALVPLPELPRPLPGWVAPSWEPMLSSDTLLISSSWTDWAVRLCLLWWWVNAWIEKLHGQKGLLMRLNCQINSTRSPFVSVTLWPCYAAQPCKRRANYNQFFIIFLKNHCIFQNNEKYVSNTMLI